MEKEETKRVRIKRKEERKSLWRSKHTENMVHSMVVEMDNLALSDEDGDFDTMEYRVMEAKSSPPCPRLAVASSGRQFAH